MTDLHPTSLLAVHGNGGGGERFDWMRPHLPTDIELVAPTLPGFGGVPADPTLTDVAGYARVLVEQLDALPRPRVALGTGIGGSFVLEVLRHHADAVDAVILHAPVGPRLDTRRFPLLLRQPLVPEIVRRVIASPIARPLIAGRFFADDTPRDRVDRVLDAYADCAVFGQQFRIITAAWWDSLPVSDVPATVLWGSEERVLDVEMAPELRQKLPAADIRTIDGWDHFPMIDTPQRYAEVITEVTRELVAAV